jgi:hypothetical protein
MLHPAFLCSIRPHPPKHPNPKKANKQHDHFQPGDSQIMHSRHSGPHRNSVLLKILAVKSRAAILEPTPARRFIPSSHRPTFRPSPRCDSTKRQPKKDPQSTNRIFPFLHSTPLVFLFAIIARLSYDNRYITHARVLPASVQCCSAVRIAPFNIWSVTHLVIISMGWSFASVIFMFRVFL